MAIETTIHKIQRIRLKIVQSSSLKCILINFWNDELIEQQHQEAYD